MSDIDKTPLVLGLLLLLCLAPSPFGPWDIDLLADALQGLLEQRENVEAGEVFLLACSAPLWGHGCWARRSRRSRGDKC